MKHITILVAAALFGASVNAQVFSSGLEDWTNDLPDDFMGSKTNMGAGNVLQVTENPHGGSSAARLINATNSHKRFTTQNVAVVENTVYDFTFWVRGTGEVRTGFYDGLSDEGTSYTYGTFYVSTGNEWVEVTQQVSCPPGATNAQFVLSVRNTAEPEHLVVDDVVITAGEVVPPTEATIYEIQYTTDVSGASPLVGQIVITSGIVTGSKAGTGYFLQDGVGPWNGIFVNDLTNNPALGDEVLITATVQENFGYTRMNNIAVYEVVSTGNTVPAAEQLNPTTASQEQWESVLVTVADVQCTSLPNNFGEWNINNWLGSMLVDDVLFASAPTLNAYYTITGPTQYAFNTWRILPRSAGDLGVGTSVNENSATSFVTYPNPANDMLTIELEATNSRTEYSLLDAAGRVVLNDVATNDRVVLNTRDLSNGVYLLTVRNNSNVRSQRVAVQH